MGTVGFEGDSSEKLRFAMILLGADSGFVMADDFGGECELTDECCEDVAGCASLSADSFVCYMAFGTKPRACVRAWYRHVHVFVCVLSCVCVCAFLQVFACIPACVCVCTRACLFLILLQHLFVSETKHGSSQFLCRRPGIS